MTERTRRAPSSGSTAIRTLLRKTQPPRSALHLTRAFTRRTNHHWSTDVAGAVAREHCSERLTVMFVVNLSIAEQTKQRHLDVSATLRLRPWRLFLFRRATTKQIRKDVAETAYRRSLSMYYPSQTP